ncbi:MAG: hypothetical protein IT236_08335 [Bacteroidia bacterium]|nr:hypothetical protein [Bacteroidia bacterium]
MKILIKTIAVLTVLAFNVVNAQTSAIPVALNNEDGTIILEWNTQKEVNSSYFVIESSENNQTFTTVSKVKGAGYSLNGKAYELEGLNSNLYYRVTLVSMEGQRQSSLVISTNLNSKGLLARK